MKTILEITLKNGNLVCECGQTMKARRLRDEFPNLDTKHGASLFETQTCVGYVSPPGHDHDDNCWTREYVCPTGHIMKIGKRRRCPACDWVGKESCGCHDCIKVDEFPDAN